MADTHDDQIAEMQRIVDRNKATGWSDLSIKERAFALSFIVSYNIIKASRDARISTESGKRALRNPIVLAYITDLQTEQGIINFITEDFIRVQYMNLLPKLAGEEEIPIVLSDGSMTEVKKFHASELISLLRDMGKTTTESKKREDDDANAFVNMFRKVVSGDA